MTPARFALALLLVLPCLASAVAEDAPPPPRQAADGEDDPAAQRAAVQRAAEAIGRDLLASDDAVRERAVQRLLTRIERGGDLGPFLDAMGRAAKDWADRRERLLELWIARAVDGTAQEREEAARLIHALGPEAVARLIDELRHAQGMAPAPERPPVARPAPPDGSSQAGDAPTQEPTEEEANAACCVPRLYHLLDLRKLGMNAVALRSLLQKVPDANEVKDVGRSVYVVTASAEGHALLEKQLAETRRALRSKAYEVKVARAEARSWHVTPVLYRVPRRLIAPSQGQYVAPQPKDARRLPTATDPNRTEVHVGSGMDAAMWMKLLQHGANRARGVRADGTATLVEGTNGSFFQGRERTFRKGLVRGKDGRWHVEQGTIDVGIHLDIAIVPDGDFVEVLLVAARNELPEPMETDTIRGPDGKTYELDRADTVRTRTRSTFRVPATGGSAFVSLGGLGSSEDEHVVVILRLQPLGKQTAKGD